ncbi:MAG: hypothetical protein ACWIPH_05070, partial [Ostreibacterium sp.]
YTYSTQVTVIDSKNEIQLGSRVISTSRNIQLDDRYVIAGEEQLQTTHADAEKSLARSTLLFLESF